MPSPTLTTTTPAPRLHGVPFSAVRDQRGPYEVVIDGNQLAPKYLHGEQIEMHPAPCAEPTSIAPGTVVLAGIKHRTKENTLCGWGVFFLRPDFGLVNGCQRIEPGQFVIFAVEAPQLVAVPRNRRQGRQ